MKDSLGIKHSFISNDYQLHGVIGQGGFGVVYKATDLKTHIPVAIKFLRIQNNNIDPARLVTRFEREIEFCGRIYHPNIVKLLNKGQCGEDLYYAVFEYVEGESLKDRLARDGSINPSETLAVMAQVLDALSHAHEKGVVHRDIKPSNIMLTKTVGGSHVTVLDFGIGAFASDITALERDNLTLTGEALGTPAYSAPEQLRGEIVTPRSDLYVWGLVFLECLTGNTAIQGESLAAVFHNQLSLSNVPLPSAIAGHSLGAFLRRVLAKKWEDRPTSAVLMHKELMQINVVNIVGDIKYNNAESCSSIYIENIKKDVLSSEDKHKTQINRSASLTMTYPEHKNLTVLCITLKIIFRGQDKRDQEVCDALHRDQMAKCIDIAARFEGYHVGKLGDCIMFYFGYPYGGTNNTRLAARSALEINRSINTKNTTIRQKYGFEIASYAGLHSGYMAVMPKEVPEGFTANTAMELCRLSPPSTITCSLKVKERLEKHAYFNEAVFPRSIKTIHQDTLFSLLGEKEAEATDFLSAETTKYKFIGRENEQRILNNFLSGNIDSSLLYLWGEAGVGKTRLIKQQKSALNQYLMCKCFPEYQNNALYPILSFLSQWLGINVNIPLDKKMSRLEKAIDNVETMDANQSLLVLCSWLELPLPEEKVNVEVTAGMHKVILYDFIIGLFSTNYAEKVQAIIVEDIHWADSMSLEFIKDMCLHENIVNSNVKIIVTSRYAPAPLFNHIKSEKIFIDKLDKTFTHKLVLKLFNNEPVSNRVINEVSVRSDGIPLYIEELVHFFLQQKRIVRKNGVFDFSHIEEMKQTPSNLIEFLQVKMDSLGYAKETIQRAAVIGREFDFSLLSTISPLPENQLHLHVSELLERDLIVLQRQMDGDRYLFKHALVQEAAYSSMNSTMCAETHQLIANTLERDKNKLYKSPVALLGHHLYLAHDFTRARIFLEQAAVDAMKKSAYLESRYYANLALKAISEVEHSISEAIKLNHIRTTATMMTSGWASKEVDECIQYSRSLLFDTSLSSEDVDFQVLWSLATYNNVRGFHSETFELIDKAINKRDLSEGERSAIFALKGHVHWMRGELITALESTNKALDLYNEETHSDHAASFGHDTKVFALSVQALIYSNQFRQSESTQKSKQAIHYAKKIGSYHSICMAKTYQCFCLYQINEYDSVIALGKEIISLCEEHGLSNWSGIVQIIIACVNGDTRSAIDGYNGLLAAGATQMQGLWNSMIAEAEIKNKKIKDAYVRIESAIKQSTEQGDHLFLPELYRLQSICYHALHKHDLAKKSEEQSNSKAKYLNIELV